MPPQTVTMKNREIVATLVRAGRRDLAEAFARRFDSAVIGALKMTPKLKAALIGMLAGYVGKSDMAKMTVEQVWVLPSDVIRIRFNGPHIVAKRAHQKLTTQWAKSKGFTTKLSQTGDDGYITLDIPVTPELEHAAESL